MTDLVIDDNTSAGDLRKAYESMRARAASAEAERDQLKTVTRSATVAELLKAKGVEDATKAAKFYPADGGSDESSVAAWVEENKGFLRITDPASATSTASQSATSTTAPSSANTAPDPNTLAAQLMALATASAGQNDSFGANNPQGAPTLDVDRMNQLAELMRNAPRTPEGYQQLAQAGIFPTNPGI